MSKELMTWSLHSLSSSSQNMSVRSMSTKLNKLLLFSYLWSVCFSQECSQWACLAEKEIVALEYTAKPVFFFFKLFIYYLFLAVLGLRFCARAFCSCGKRGPLFIAVRGPLTIAASLVVEHRLQTRRLSSCGSRA